MRTRLLVAILALVAGTLLLASLGSIFLIRRAAVDTAEQQLYSQARAIAELSPSVFLNRLRAVKLVGQYDALGVVGLRAEGTFTGPIPAAMQGLDLQTGQLLKNSSVAGSVGHLVYVLIPLEFTTAQKAALSPPVPYQDTAVLVATRTTEPAVNGTGYFLLVSLAALGAAAALAYGLANRFSRPLVRAAKTTERIAGGDLLARMPQSPSDMPEFAALAAAINTMGDRLEEAREQQRQFLLSVSHDLRTPLTSIRGYAEALADGTTNDVPGAVGVIAAEARRLERLVQDLLDLARLDAQRFTLDSDPVDVGVAVSSTMDSFGPEAVGMGLELSSSVPTAGEFWVTADRDRLAQMFSNLIENAFKFAAHRVEVGGRVEENRVLIWVLDDGPGIPPQDIPHVFEPHFTSDRSGPRKAGTGLGLAIVAELAAAMGGGVHAESPAALHGGTRITIWLPRAGSRPGYGLGNTAPQLPEQIGQ